MSKYPLADARVRDTARELRLADKQRADGRGVPAVGYDVENAPAIDALARAEQSALKRMSPRWRNRWPELVEIDERIEALEAREQDVRTATAALREHLNVIDAQDAERVASWFARGEPGERPASRRAGLEAELHEREVEAEGIRRAVERAEDDRVRVVERHRRRLLADAERLVDQRLQAALDAVDAVRAARAALVEAADLRAWTACFPDESAGKMANYAAFGASTKRAHELLGARSTLDASAVIAALEEDARVVARILSSEQHACLAARGEAAPAPGEAVWAADESGRADRRRELDEAAVAYAREFGHPPRDDQLEAWLQERQRGVA